VTAAVFQPAVDLVRQLMLEKQSAIVAIDGRCGSGKTTLATLLARLFPCTVVHMDDFYLPMANRQPDWEQQVAGNMDLERFRAEVLEPVLAGRPVAYRRFDCRTGQLSAAEMLPFHALTIVEGSYAHHPRLADCYDRKIFLTCDAQIQAQRLMEREGERRFPLFRDRWIPMEERYLACFPVAETADLVLDTTNDENDCQKAGYSLPAL
jgi:uridine kinase